MEKKITFGKKLKYLREQKGWTQQEAAEALGTYQQQYQKLEGDVIEPSLRRLKDLSRIFGVDANWLLESPTISNYMPFNIRALPLFEEETLSSFRLRKAILPESTAMAELRKIAFFLDTDDESAFAYPIIDDSMYPEFMPGEIAAVSPQEEVRQGDFALVNLDGKIMIRQILFTPKENIIILKVLNSQCKDDVVDKKQTKFVMLGRVICKQKRYR